MEDEVLEQTGGAETQAEEIVDNAEEQTGGADDSEAQGEAIANAFTPDFKFNANKTDMEIPEEFRAHIKDVESNKKIKEIFEKYHGFDTQKEKLTAIEQDATKYRSNYEGLASNIQSIQAGYKHAVESGNLHNLDTVFQKLGIGEDILMGWAVEKAKLQGLDPEQQKMVMRQNQLEREAFERSNYENSLMTENQEKDREIRQMQFDSAMSNPQIKNFATELDSKFGMNGLFAQEVINAGKTAYALEQKVLSVQEAMHAVITKYNLKGQAVAASTPAQGQPAQGNVSADGKKIVQRDQKVIPNVGSSSGGSPVGQPKAKNLDDVRRRYAELKAQG